MRKRPGLDFAINPRLAPNGKGSAHRFLQVSVSLFLSVLSRMHTETTTPGALNMPPVWIPLTSLRVSPVQLEDTYGTLILSRSFCL
jgi:hypothetical protein